MRRASILALCCLLCAGCSVLGRKSSAKDGGIGKSSSDAPGYEIIAPGPVQVVGRVISVDFRSLSAVVEIGPYAKLPADFSGRQLVSRTDDLSPTARLQASPYLRGRALGVRLLAGRPQVGDEVVLAP